MKKIINVILDYIPLCVAMLFPCACLNAEALDGDGDYYPVSMDSVVNMGFRDEIAADHQGGWTDQGRGNDLVDFPVGLDSFSGIPFYIINPEENGGKSCLVLKGTQRPYFPPEAIIPMDGEHAVKVLYLLHGYGWFTEPNTPLGTIEVKYVDGSQESIELTTHIDASNWMVPYDTPNGRVGWMGKNKSGEIGLNVSSFPLSGKPIKELKLKSVGRVVWMIAGITASDKEDLQSKRNVKNEEYVITENDKWKPIDFAYNTAPGSALDFSFLLDAPAGKYGRVIVNGDKFVFEDDPEKRIRFLGTSLVFDANFPDHDDAEVLSDRIASAGYNSVRFHHYDQGLLRADAVTSYDFDEDKLDRMDYLFSCLKERGIYVTMSLYSLRTFKASEVPDFGEDLSYGKVQAYVAVSDMAFESWKNFAKKLLLHKNPYTGLTYAEDPALYAINPINENCLQVFWDYHPKVRDAVRRAFSIWIEDQGGNAGTPASLSSPLFVQFLTELQIDVQRRMFDYIQNEVSSGVLLTDISHRTYRNLTLARQDIDFVDIHRYWDHPKTVNSSAFKIPFCYQMKSSVGNACQLPRELFFGRVIGKPFTVTEYNFCYPNPYRFEAGPAMGAYASLQGWNGLYRYDYGGPNVFMYRDGVDSPCRITVFDTFNDPVALLSDRLIALLFLRRDVEEGKTTIAYEVNPDALFNSEYCGDELSNELSMLGLISKVGSTISDDFDSDDIDAYILPGLSGDHEAVDRFTEGPLLVENLVRAGVIDSEDYSKSKFCSDTGEIVLEPDLGRLSVTTERTEAFFCEGKGKYQGEFLQADTSGPCTISASAMDGKSLANSDYILIMHLTDVQSDGITYGDESHRVMNDWGKGAPLLNLGSVKCVFNVMSPGPEWELWSVDLSGNRMDIIPLSVEGNRMEATLSGFDNNRASMVYVLVRENGDGV